MSRDTGMPKHTFLSQQTVNQQIEKLETLIRVGELMDWASGWLTQWQPG